MASAQALATPGPAGAPTGVTATPGDQKITVSWTAPANTGGGIDHYTATVSPGGQSCSTLNNATFTCDITGLTAGTAYTVSVVAVGSSGTGTSASGTATATPGPPSAPTAVTGVAGNGQVTVSWTVPANLGGGVDHYTVTANPGGATCTTANGSATSCTITGLTNGTAYTFTVVAYGVGATGNSPASAASMPVTPGIAPGARTA
jgi:hypothetical protein